MNENKVTLMIERKVVTTLLATPLSLLVIFAVFFGEWRQPVELIVMSGAFSLLISPYILLYGVPVTFLSDYVGKRITRKMRMPLAFIFHLFFGVIFGFIFPMNSNVSVFGVAVDSAFIFASITALLFWTIDEILRGLMFKSNSCCRSVYMKKWLAFLLGAVLFLTSLPIGALMAMEHFHNKRMDNRYKIENVNKGDPPTGSAFNFKNHYVEVKEEIKEGKRYIDRFNYNIALADLSIEVNGVEIDTLRNNPIRVDEKGLNRYYGEIAYLLLEDKKNSKTEFIILLRKTKELNERIERIYDEERIWFGPAENLFYTTYVLNETGELKSESFSLFERDALQTEFINFGRVAQSWLGYYTDAWVQPSLIFGYVNPFFTLPVGMILLAYNIPFRRKEIQN
jgi:hypothetical protein